MPCLVIVLGKARPPNTWWSSQPGRGDPSFKPAPMPTARHLAGAASLGPDVAGVFGGQSTSYLSINEVYNAATNTWATKASMPTTWHQAAAASLGPGLAGVFMGGSTMVYDLATNTWATKTPMPTSRSFPAAAPLGPGVVAVIGGAVSSHNEVYNLTTNTWTAKAPMPTARYLAGAASLGPDVVGVFGGTPDGVSVLSANEVYNAATNTWAAKASLPTARRALAAAPIDLGVVGVFGGGSGTADSPIIYATNEVYNHTANTWLAKAPMPTSRSGLAAAELGPGLVGTWGGYTNPGYTNVTEIYSY